MVLIFEINEEKTQINNMNHNQEDIEKNNSSNKKVKNYNIEVEENIELIKQNEESKNKNIQKIN